jgi:endonuclease IV
MESKGTGAFLVGTHTCKGKHKDISDAISTNFATAPSVATQIFTHGPHSLNANKIDIAAVRALARRVKIYVHEPYRAHIFKGDPKMMDAMVNVFEVAAACGSSGVVVHLPRAKVETVIEHVSTLMKQLEEKKIDVPLILETPSNKAHPTMSWESPKKLQRLTSALRAANLGCERVGICIDTAHIFAGGAQIKTREEALAYLSDVPMERVHLFHLNGNEYEGRAGDKHAIPCSPPDKIWGGKKYKESGCFEFVEWARSYKIPVIFEDKPHHSRDDTYKFIQMCGRV